MEQSIQKPDAKGRDRALQIVAQMKLKPLSVVAREMGMNVTTVRYYINKYGFDTRILAEQRNTELRIADELGTVPPNVTCDKCDQCGRIITRPAPLSHSGPRWCTKFAQCKAARYRYMYAHDYKYRAYQQSRARDNKTIKSSTRKERG